MKDRSSEPRSYSGALMGIGEPGEVYIGRYLEREYVKVIPVGKEKRRRDYRCFLANGTVHLVEGKTDTRIADASGVDPTTVRDSVLGNPKTQPTTGTSKDYPVSYRQDLSVRRDLSRGKAEEGLSISRGLLYTPSPYPLLWRSGDPELIPKGLGPAALFSIRHS